MKKFDFVIIGSGQAGVPLAFSLSKKGTVALIEKSFLGGTCVNNGCVPTKAYVASARRMWDSLHGEEMGIDIPAGAKANLEKIKARKDILVKGSREGIEKSISSNDKITLFRGEAHFISNYKIAINDDKITAKQIFINVGARAIIPKEFSKVDYLTNVDILELAKLPEHLIIIGGSYIGLEFGQMFKRFGSKVTIIESGDRLISKEDENVSDAIATILQEDDIAIEFNAEEINVTQGGTEILVEINGGDKEITGTHLLLAVGRAPNTDTLQLENTSIMYDEEGYITVDDYCKTNTAGIFAIGDCNGKGAFTHTSYNDFQIVEEYILGAKKRKISDRITTYGLFIDPPLARVGMTKAEATEKGFSILIGRRPMDKIGRAKEKGETKGFMEAIIDAKTNQFLGACVLGVGGDEIISGITNLMYAKQPYTIFRDAIHIHPTVSELIPTMLEDLQPTTKE
ncbi:mercuric reductase [Flavobacterium xanthum]|uniref:Pyruvate/2-oxoglutarate dehydrogenase complex, dihydrolipoamide dehydrogenase (E3) component n=1 Tax=Flavobacterium xanthum TaxID=69322 RepID=A0A1M7KF69_9FLAO|nr:mercuric reductase [Flavobacterium xanthum]SHM63950.1 Pyruvate/2-oxoglutarate dehydrogenase complex, dihydrolipoamide dehydrogenase (E3) component [Flavobacterium xanthum]